MADTGIALGIKLDDSRLLALAEQGPALVARRLSQIVEGGAIDTQREMRIQANVGVTGMLRGSIRYSFSVRTLTAVVEPAVDYAEDVEKGTPPHHVSVAEGSSLRKWADMKGVDPYSIQEIIERKGTNPHPFVAPTYNKMKPKIQQQFEDGIEKLVGDLNNGGL